MNFKLYGMPACLLSDAESIFEVIIYRGELVFQSFVPIQLKLKETRIFSIENASFEKENIRRRYQNMRQTENDIIETIVGEAEDDYSDDSLFNISSWGADLSFRELVSMYKDDELVKPELQRKYVWDKTEASRFIESILLGLPVPSIFLAQSGSQKLIVDGYQRIMTVYDYMEGIFSADRKVFKLSNSEKINKRWRNKAFSELTTDDQRRIRSTTIHAIIFEQKKPENDDTSLYQVFERINTSGQTLTPQEIRNCVYQGSFNKMLFELNDNKIWRILFGTTEPDSRMRDIEYILRFFLMKTDSILNSKSRQISLKKSLNSFMSEHKDSTEEEVCRYKKEFEDTIQAVYEHLGSNAFRNYAGDKVSKKFHPAIYDAVMVSAWLILMNGLELPKVSEEKHIELLNNESFKMAISNRTTDIENINQRISLAGEILFGVNLR